MQEHRKPFKRPPKRFEPKGLSILFEDHDIIVVDKVHGLLTVGSEAERDKTAYNLLSEYVRKGNSKSRNRIFIVHRLDRETSGILVFAKTEEAKRFLMTGWLSFEKRYFAVVHGRMPNSAGQIESYLAESGVHRMYSVRDREKGKLSKTAYKVIETTKRYSLLEVQLLTGRKHQIRVHLSDQNCPIVGDKKYGSTEKGIKRLALHASSLTIVHPHTKEPLSFDTKMPAYLESLIRNSSSAR